MPGRFVIFVALFSACDAGEPVPSAPKGSPALAKAAPQGSPLPARWELTFSTSFGRETCIGGDRICMQSWRLTETGPLSHAEYVPIGAKNETVVSESILSADQRARIEGLLGTEAFAKAIAAGLPCTSSSAHDMSLTLTFADRTTGTRHGQSLAVCMLGKQDNVLMQVATAMAGQGWIPPWVNH